MAEQLDDAHIRRELDFASDRTQLQPLQRAHGVFGRIGIAARPGRFQLAPMHDDLGIGEQVGIGGIVPV
jgi:hypothetical protein